MFQFFSQNMSLLIFELSPFCPIIDLQVVGLYLKKVVVQNSFSDQCSAKAQAEQLT